MILDLVNQIVVEGHIPVEWKLRTIINCYKRKSNSLERGKYSRLKLADQILRIAERVIEKLIR